MKTNITACAPVFGKLLQYLSSPCDASGAGRDHAERTMTRTEICKCGHVCNDHWEVHGVCLEPYCLCLKFDCASNPSPLPNESTPIWDLVIADMKARDHVGRQRYGTPLQAHNGRDALQDAYEEALDVAVYLRQAIEERKGRS